MIDNNSLLFFLMATREKPLLLHFFGNTIKWPGNSIDVDKDIISMNEQLTISQRELKTINSKIDAVPNKKTNKRALLPLLKERKQCRDRINIISNSISVIDNAKLNRDTLRIQQTVKNDLDILTKESNKIKREMGEIEDIHTVVDNHHEIQTDINDINNIFDQSLNTNETDESILESYFEEEEEQQHHNYSPIIENKQTNLFPVNKSNDIIENDPFLDKIFDDLEKLPVHRDNLNTNIKHKIVKKDFTHKIF